MFLAGAVGERSVEFKQTAYALDRVSQKVALARFLQPGRKARSYKLLRPISLVKFMQRITTMNLT